MEMKVHLIPDVFEIVKSGTKNVECRLNDEKRRQLKVGDTIIFIKKQALDEEIKVQVEGLDYYDSFSTLIDHYEMKRLYKEDYTKEKLLELLSEFYTEEEQKKYGVVAIRFKKW